MDLEERANVTSHRIPFDVLLGARQVREDLGMSPCSTRINRDDVDCHVTDPSSGQSR